MGKLIDITKRIKKPDSNMISSSQVSEVVDIGPLRTEKIQQDRREVRRTILTEFISLHAVVPGQGLLKVSLYDINERGLSFDMEERRGSYNLGDKVELRVYLNYKTYFPISMKVARVANVESEGVIRHGCEFVSESLNQEALRHFVGFLETVTAAFRRDHGDILVTKLPS